MRIPDFDILWKSGHGASGEVWIARNRAGSLVALKTIEKSEQAARELAGLRSYFQIAGAPHLIRIFHIGEVGNVLYYTMELADNLGTEQVYIPATLGNLLQKKKRLSPAETIDLGRKLLDGLATLHRNGLIHRDIKPENILFVGGEPKLSDIGLIRSVTHSLSLGGTLGFIPPERLKSGTGGKDSADDLYALGKVLYCCLTGNAVEEYPSFPHSLLSPEYSHLNEVILTACNKNPALRFRSAGEFSRSLTEGGSGKKRGLSRCFQFRYLGVWLGAVILFTFAWQRLIPDLTSQSVEVVKEPLPLGGILHRTRLSMSASTGESGEEVTQTDSIDPVFEDFSPYELDSSPRSREVVFERFSGAEWQSIDSRNFRRSPDTLRGEANAEGGLRFMRPLEYPYAIRFEIDYEKLEDLLTFQVATLNTLGIDRSFYQWSLQKEQGKLILNPLEYQEENGERKILIHPVGQPKDTPGFHRVEMVQTSKMFRLYIDGELVLYAPSFFCGGYFAIFARGGDANFVELKNFELLKIFHQPECPPEKQYRLPGKG